MLSYFENKVKSVQNWRLVYEHCVFFLSLILAISLSLSLSVSLSLSFSFFLSFTLYLLLTHTICVSLSFFLSSFLSLSLSLCVSVCAYFSLFFSVSPSHSMSFLLFLFVSLQTSQKFQSYMTVLVLASFLVWLDPLNRFTLFFGPWKFLSTLERLLSMNGLFLYFHMSFPIVSILQYVSFKI